jgi:SAM-dependent methyltransferase
MWSDVIDLRDFYGTMLGQMARRVIRQRIRETWPDTRGMRVLGIGYPSPYLLPFRDNAERVISVMPARQGVLRWPAEGPNLVTLADEAELPLPDVSIDRVLMVHALECSEQLRPMLREIWRVMADGGQLLAVVPNRHGIWARMDRTPFGHGHPYTPTQITRLLRDNMFAPTGTAYGLFMPPSRRRMVIASAPAWERLGARWVPHFGGVLFIEATKQIYAGTPEAVPARRRRHAYAPAANTSGRNGEATRERPE